MGIKKVRKKNGQQFIDDLNKVREVMVAPVKTNVFLKTTKKEVIKEAENEKINYYITDQIFKVRRDVMVII